MARTIQRAEPMDQRLSMKATVSDMKNLKKVAMMQGVTVSHLIRDVLVQNGLLTYL